MFLIKGVFLVLFAFSQTLYAQLDIEVLLEFAAQHEEENNRRKADAQVQREQEERIEGDRAAYARESGLSHSEMVLFRTVMRGEVYDFDLDKIRQFVREGGNIDAKDSMTGVSAVHLAALTKNLAALEVLKEVRADMKATDNEGRTALDWLNAGNWPYAVSVDFLLPNWIRQAYEKSYIIEYERRIGLSTTDPIIYKYGWQRITDRHFDIIGLFLVESGVDRTAPATTLEKTAIFLNLMEPRKSQSSEVPPEKQTHEESLTSPCFL